MKKLLLRQKTQSRHWVGDGFPVQNIFGYNDLAKDISPFLMMDYIGPAAFPPTREKKGVGAHPHRGFETVTIVYSGEVEHRDSAGGGGRIGSDEVQWMTAASGVVHEEFHGRDFAEKGGVFEAVQLWVNLPKKDKMAKPRYQGLTKEMIPSVKIGTNGSVVRVIAGEFEGVKGPGQTFTPMNLWDLRLGAGTQHEFKIPVGHSTVVFVLNGQVRLGTGEEIVGAELVSLDTTESNFTLESLAETKVLIMSGVPLNEPIVGYGPFVMNTMGEIKQAFVDFEAGRMGQLVGAVE
ncbi:MAG: pirin family protein [Bdellovibrionales bacterium]|nr:pirin family protein [Bdellovibrionales bacterium]